MRLELYCRLEQVKQVTSGKGHDMLQFEFKVHGQSRMPSLYDQYAVDVLYARGLMRLQVGRALTGAELPDYNKAQDYVDILHSYRGTMVYLEVQETEYSGQSYLRVRKMKEAVPSG